MPLLPWIYFAVLLGYGITACLGDVITTMRGLSTNTFVEGNPVARWMFAKFGESLASWISIVAYIFAAAGFTNLNYKAGMLFTGAIAVTETVMFIRNYSFLKKAKISLF